jgi:hypothetical protein
MVTQQCLDIDLLCGGYQESTWALTNCITCNAEETSPAFEEFLLLLGKRIRLKGFTQFKGGLDVKGI